MLLKQNKCFQVSTRKFNFKQYFLCVLFFNTYRSRNVEIFIFLKKTLRLIYYQCDVLLSILEIKVGECTFFFQNSLVSRGNSFSYLRLNLFIQILTLKFRIMICVSRISYFELNLIWAFVHRGLNYIKSKLSKS